MTHAKARHNPNADMAITSGMLLQLPFMERLDTVKGMLGELAQSLDSTVSYRGPEYKVSCFGPQAKGLQGSVVLCAPQLFVQCCESSVNTQ